MGGKSEIEKSKMGASEVHTKGGGERRRKSRELNASSLDVARQIHLPDAFSWSSQAAVCLSFG